MLYQDLLIVKGSKLLHAGEGGGLARVRDPGSNLPRFASPWLLAGKRHRLKTFEKDCKYDLFRWQTEADFSKQRSIDGNTFILTDL
jgi:hypothetical protein